MDDDEYVGGGPSWLRLVWPRWVYSQEPDASGMGGPVQHWVAGSIVNSAYCPVTQKWHMLVSGSDGRFYDLTHDHPDLLHEWTSETLGSENDD